MIRYLSLAEYFWLAGEVTDSDAAVLAKAGRVDLADSALSAPAGSFGGQDFYPDVYDKAAVSYVASRGIIRSRTETSAPPGLLLSCSSI